MSVFGVRQQSPQKVGGRTYPSGIQRIVLSVAVSRCLQRPVGVGGIWVPYVQVPPHAAEGNSYQRAKELGVCMKETSGLWGENQNHCL